MRADQASSPSRAGRGRGRCRLTLPAPPDVDDSLQLLLLCCHPALTRSSQVALTLRAVSGLGTAEIAAAFLVPEATMGQRLSRAKATLRDSGARFELPEPRRSADPGGGRSRCAAPGLQRGVRAHHGSLARRLRADPGGHPPHPAAVRRAARSRRGRRCVGPHAAHPGPGVGPDRRARRSRPARRPGPVAMGPGLDRRGRRDPGGGAPARPRRPVPAAGGHRRRARGGADLGRHRLAAAQPAVPDAVRPRAEPGRDAEPRGGGRHGPRSRARTGDRAGPAGGGAGDEPAPPHLCGTRAISGSWPATSAARRRTIGARPS